MMEVLATFGGFTVLAVLYAKFGASESAHKIYDDFVNLLFGWGAFVLGFGALYVIFKAIG